MGDFEKIEVEGDLFIPFEWLDKTPGGSNLGRAEFSVCIKYKRGKVSEYFVYPEQQRNMNIFWHWQGKRDDLTISSYDGLEDAKVWMFYYCKTHKTQSFRLYVPPNAKYLHLSYNGLDFTKTDWGRKSERMK